MLEDRKAKNPGRVLAQGDYSLMPYSDFSAPKL
jgi:hypothetical protein